MDGQDLRGLALQDADLRGLRLNGSDLRQGSRPEGTGSRPGNREAESTPLSGFSTRTYNRLTWLFIHQCAGPPVGRADYPDDTEYEAARDARWVKWEEIEGALTLGDLTTVTEAELMVVPSSGVGCLAEVKATLARYGLSLAG